MVEQAFDFMSQLVPEEYRESNGAKALREVFNLEARLKQQYPEVNLTERGQTLKGADLREVIAALLSQTPDRRALAIDCPERADWQALIKVSKDRGTEPYVRYPKLLLVSARVDRAAQLTIKTGIDLGTKLVTSFGQQVVYEIEQGVLNTGQAAHPRKAVGTRINLPIR